MAKDLKNRLRENNNVEELTKGYFSSETLKEDVEQPRAKRKYTKLSNKENKTHTITMRLTETEYNNLLAKAEKSKSQTITEYLTRLIEKGL